MVPSRGEDKAGGSCLYAVPVVATLNPKNNYFNSLDKPSHPEKQLNTIKSIN